MSLTSYRAAPPRGIGCQMSDDGCQRSSERSSGMTCEGFGVQDPGARHQASGRRAALSRGSLCPSSWFLTSDLCCEDRAATYSPASCDAVPSARRGFTVEFGMGSGGAPSPWPPGRRSRGQKTEDRRGRRWRAEVCFSFLSSVFCRLACVGGWGSGEAIERDRAIRTG